MPSVTRRINEIQQPYGGYLPAKLFSKVQLDDGIFLHEEENIHSGLVGLAVDYLTRYMSGSTVDQAFHISILGAQLISLEKTAESLKAQITGLDDASITAACKLVGFDVCFRSSAYGYKPVEEISPNKATLENIRTMVQRSMNFWEKYGPILCSEPTFEGGYTTTVNAGDGDYVTHDTIWDFKVSKSAPKSKQTLQILMYYIMGLHSTHEFYKNITQLGFYNPRLNIVYICPVANISDDVIREVEEKVICYDQPHSKSSNRSRNINTKKTEMTYRTTTARTTAQHTINSYGETTEEEYTVSDICTLTGKSKSDIYKDIHSGKLTAYKKSNKYTVSRNEYERYRNYLEAERKQNYILLSVAAAVLVVFIVFIFAIIR